MLFRGVTSSDVLGFWKPNFELPYFDYNINKWGSYLKEKISYEVA
jgi:hypothetical protein